MTTTADLHTARPIATTLSALIREWAERTPSAVAMTFEGRHTTFSELDAAADRWAKALMAAGVQRGEGVAVLTGNHPHFLIAAIAAARVGAHLAPGNTWHTAAELEHTIRHSGAVLLLTTGRLRQVDFHGVVQSFLPELLEGTSDGFTACPALRQVISLQDEISGGNTLQEFLDAGNSIADDELNARELGNTPADLLYVLYTSGSTSAPKGVLLQQGPAIENGWWMGQRQGITAEDRSWIATPLFYGVSALQALFATWTHGARIVLQEVFETAGALQLLEQERCTVYFGFGNLTRKLLSHPGFDSKRVYLRKGMIGFSVEDRRLAIDELGVAQGVSVFGMTELYGLATLTDHCDDRSLTMTTQGFPLPGNDLRIVDPVDGHVLPRGQVGAIQVKGRVTLGYLHDPERTSAAFTGDGYFRTGDLGSLDESGRLVYDSRLTETMKPGGVNVSPQEVERLLDEVPGVKQAHVCSIPDQADGEVIVAFVEADPDVTTPDFIKTHLRDRVAKYKIPRHILYRADDQLPRVASGKISIPKLREQAGRELQGVSDVPGGQR